MLKKTRIGIVFLSISVFLSLSGCGRSAKQEDSGSVDNTENVNTVDTDVSEADNAIIPLKNEITEDTSIQEQISVTEGEWTLRISFGYYCGNMPGCLKIAAAYENPTEDDINWLKEERLTNEIW